MRFVKYTLENERVFKFEKIKIILMDGDNKTLEDFLDNLSFSLAKEFIRKSKEDEEKPSRCVYLYGHDLETMFFISSKIYDHLSKEGYYDVVFSYGEQRVDIVRSELYQLDIGGFFNLNESVRAKNGKLELV